MVTKLGAVIRQRVLVTVKVFVSLLKAKILAVSVLRFLHLVCMTQQKIIYPRKLLLLSNTIALNRDEGLTLNTSAFQNVPHNPHPYPCSPWEDR